MPTGQLRALAGRTLSLAPDQVKEVKSGCVLCVSVDGGVIEGIDGSLPLVRASFQDALVGGQPPSLTAECPRRSADHRERHARDGDEGERKVRRYGDVAAIGPGEDATQSERPRAQLADRLRRFAHESARRPA